jgi:hypothetical protein
MTLPVLPVPFSNGVPVPQGDLFRVHRERCGRQLEAVCQLVTHQLGWELRLEINRDLQRSEVCRTRDAALDTSEQWQAAMIEKGWR